MDLGDASRLFVGKGGERWLVQVREGAAVAAPMLADEDLVAVSRPEQDVFAFIGSKGTIYTSESPLGSFTSARRMEPAPLRVAAAGKFIVAVHWDGTLARSTDGGKTFAPLSLPAANPLYDVALADDGRAMVLGFPEQLWISKDILGTDPRFALAGTPTVGAGQVGVDAVGFLVARGVRESITWRTGDQGELTVSDRPFEPAAMDLWTDLEPGPSASALASGRATLSAGQYFEVARGEEQGPWFLGRGEITERLRWTPIPQSEDCRHMAIAVHGERLVFGCMAGARKGGVLFPPLRVIQSRDGGGSFTKQSTGLVADEEAVFLTVLDDDTLLVSGACKPNTRGICAPAEPMRLTPVRESRRLQYGAAEPVQVPRIVGRVNRVVASGDRLYSTGLLLGGRPAVLVSDDQGETFRAVPLDLAKTSVAEQHDIEKLLGRMQPGKLSVGEEGRLSWLLFTEEGPVWVVIDERGRVVSANLAPLEYSLLETAGSRGLAFKSDAQLVESSDGGATFRSLTRMPAWMWEGEESPVAVCGAAGCVVGEEFSRLGWGAAGGGVLSQQQDGATKDPEASEAAVPEKAPARTPIVCEIIDPSPGMIQNVVSLPNAGDAMRGTVAWSALVVDRTNASVSVAHGTATPKHAVRMIPLLSPVPNATRFAMEARTQVEGAAALRYVLDTDSEGNPGRPMGRVEVAWDNQFEGPPQRAVIPQGGVVRARDAVIVSGNAARAQVEMLSVAPGGIHVCPHAECNQPGDRVLFLRGRGPVDSIPLTPWPTRGLGGNALPLSHHITQADGKHVPIATHQHQSVVMRAHRRDDGSHAFSALALAPSDSKGLGMAEVTHWSYHTQGTMGLSHTLYHPTQDVARAWVVSFDASQGVGTTVSAPTQRDLSDPPAPCTSAQRKGSYRVVSPALTGTQHPVIVESGNTKALMHTRVAVLHGDPDSACAEVLDARSEQTSRQALIPVGAMDRSWLLGLDGTTLRWWPMRCRFQKGASVDDSNATLFPHETSTKEALGRATESDCTEIFNKIAPVMAGLPQSALDPARRAFVEMCKEKSVNMPCVRQTSDPQQILQNCMK